MIGDSREHQAVREGLRWRGRTWVVLTNLLPPEITSFVPKFETQYYCCKCSDISMWNCLIGILKLTNIVVVIVKEKNNL